MKLYITLILVLTLLSLGTINYYRLSDRVAPFYIRLSISALISL